MELNELLKELVKLAAYYKIDQPYMVGGVPRDVALGKKNIKTTDVDITTNTSDVTRLGILFSDKFSFSFSLSDDGHLTAFVDSFDIDFSSNFISEKVLDIISPEQKKYAEAFSRDFTINTLHQDIMTKEITDPTGMGLQDVKDKIIRTPVPVEITFTDDPRRVYRAILLSVRYGFKIDQKIIDFVKNNKELFTIEGGNIKGKFISLKMNKALKENEEETLNILKEMDLLNVIPLSGYYKDVLIKRKLIPDYLGKE